MNIIEIENLNYKYPGERNFVLKDINLDITDKSFAVLIGTFIQGLLSGWFAWIIYKKIKNTLVIKRIQR